MYTGKNISLIKSYMSPVISKLFPSTKGLLVIVFLAAFLLMSALPVNAKVVNQPEGAWSITGKGSNGSIGSIVPIEFSITYILDRCAYADAYIETIDEARQKISFVGSAVPADNVSISPERVKWPVIEFENYVAIKFQVQARIDQGVVGDEVDGFRIYAGCSGKSIFKGVVDDIKIKIEGPKQENSPKPIPLSTPSPTKQPGNPTASASSTITPKPIKVSKPIVPVNTIDPSNDEVVQGTVAGSYDLQTVTPQPLENMHIDVPPPTPKRSIISRFSSNLPNRFSAVAKWFSRLF